MIQNHRFLILIFVVSLTLVGCSDKPHYDKFYSFDSNEWKQTVKPEFEVDIQDTSKWYDMKITIRTSTEYAYNNLWIFLNTETPSGIKAREPFQIQITDEQGRWLGRKSGTTVEQSLVFRKRKFPEKGKYQFMLEQGIIEETIGEVLNVGITVQEYKVN